MHWLYRRHVDAAWQLAYRILQRKDLAQDCVQEAFVKAFANLGQLDDPLRFSGWLMRIVHNKALDLCRREKRHVAQPLENWEAGKDDDADFLLRRRVMTAVESLEEGTRDVFVNYYLLGRKHSEIATMLNIAEGSSKRRLFNAREQLRNLLEDLV